MKLSHTLTIDSIDYASQGNAILGIRGSGKSYTATFIAEQLMDSHIPFIAFDPIGIWRNLKIGKDGPGFPVVVAGENADLPLTPQNAPDIVRAAMKENVCLVIDLYSMKHSKADWRSIVAKSIELLLYENKPCGLRHIFIEEAAEFVPQRIQPGYGVVYAEIEKLARMGGNASLGYTLINQRPEEINKAVLELCNCLILHGQRGRHSLTALGKWLDVASTKNADKVISSLPSLEPGCCWVWSEGSHEPQYVQIPEKLTIHPDRKNPLGAAKGIVSPYIDDFVSLMKRSMAEKSGGKPKKEFDGSSELAALRKALQQKDDRIRQLELLVEHFQRKMEQIQEIAWAKMDSSPVEAVGILEPPTSPSYEKVARKKAPISQDAGKALHQEANEVPAGPLRYLKAAASFFPGTISKKRMCALAGVSYKKSTHRTYMAYLKQHNLLEVVQVDQFRATEKGLKLAGAFDDIPSSGPELIEFWCSKLGQGPATYLRTLAKKYPRSVKKEDLAKTAGTEYTKSTHRTYMAELNAMGLIETSSDGVKLADALYE